MATYYGAQNNVKPQHRRSQTPFPSSTTHSRDSTPGASTRHTTPDPPSSLNNLMATHLFPTLLKRNPDRPLIINLGTLNLSDASSSSDDGSLATATTAASLSGASTRYTYRDPPSARSSSYYYCPSSYSASFNPKEGTRDVRAIHPTAAKREERYQSCHGHISRQRRWWWAVYLACKFARDELAGFVDFKLP